MLTSAARGSCLTNLGSPRRRHTHPCPSQLCQRPHWTVNRGRPLWNVGIELGRLKWTSAQMSTCEDTRTCEREQSNPIQWHRSWPQCAANCLISLWPRSSFLSTFFQVFGRDLFSLSALFKDLLYAGSPPDVVLQSSHCLSLSPSLSFSLHTSLRPASPLSPTYLSLSL